MNTDADSVFQRRVANARQIGIHGGDEMIYGETNRLIVEAPRHAKPTVDTTLDSNL